MSECYCRCCSQWSTKVERNHQQWCTSCKPWNEEMVFSIFYDIIDHSILVNLVMWKLIFFYDYDNQMITLIVQYLALKNKWELAFCPTDCSTRCDAL